MKKDEWEFMHDHLDCEDCQDEEGNAHRVIAYEGKHEGREAFRYTCENPDCGNEWIEYLDEFFVHPDGTVERREIDPDPLEFSVITVRGSGRIDDIQTEQAASEEEAAEIAERRAQEPEAAAVIVKVSRREPTFIGFLNRSGISDQCENWRN